MKLQKGNMWEAYDEAALFLFTSNGTLTRDGGLVMGRGLAYEVATRFPGIDTSIGKAITAHGTYDNNERAWQYGLLPGRKLGAFQVKYYWADPANTWLIGLSVGHLVMWLDRHEGPVHLNFPGIGNGRLKESLVLPYIEQLNDRVTVWKKF